MARVTIDGVSISGRLREPELTTLFCEQGVFVRFDDAKDLPFWLEAYLSRDVLVKWLAEIDEASTNKE